MERLIELYKLSFLNDTQSLMVTTIGLLSAIILSQLLRVIYQKFSNSLSDHQITSGLLTPLTLCVFLIVASIKNSLALSLGTIGALSIVRFRTPVKSTEDLVYIFLAVATGICLGANQIFITYLVHSVFVIYTIINYFLVKQSPPATYDVLIQSNSLLEREALDSITSELTQISKSLQILRFENTSLSGNEIAYKINITELNKLINLVTIIQKRHPHISISFYLRNGVS
jgi:hypothetical protein